MTRTIGGRYALHERLGKGGAGSVYRATDRLTGSIVALKQVTMPARSRAGSLTGSTSPADVLRLALASEFQTLASLHHPNIIGVLDYGFALIDVPDISRDSSEQTGDNIGSAVTELEATGSLSQEDHARQPYFTMEYLEGSRTLIEARDQPLEVRLDLLIQVLQALAYLHRRGIVHRDIKPGNVLIVALPGAAGPTGEAVSGARLRAQVLDFGLSLSRGQVSGVGGTIAYMPPEVLAGSPASETSDLYSVGIMAYELLAGRHPYNLGDSVSLIHDIFHSRPWLGAVEGGPALGEVVGRMLHKDPAARFSSAEACIAALCAAVGQPPPAESAAIRESYLQAAQFVGREAELGCLKSALADALAGRGSAWLVGGESGVGKTRLLDELRIHASVAGVRVLRAQGTAGGSPAYQFWRDPLRLLALTTELSDLEAGILKPLMPDVEALLDRPIPDVPGLGEVGRQRLLSTILGIFGRQTAPTLLILEDLHWAAEGLDVLRQLTRRLSHLRLLVVGSYRDDEVPHLPAGLPGVHPLKLERLSGTEIADLSASILGEAGRRPDVVALLQRETEGNAFFLVEVIRALAEQSGELSGIAGMPLPAQVFPLGIQTIVHRRLDRVPEARSLLRLAAVAGRYVDLKIVASLAEGADVDAWLAACANAAVLELRDGRWRFAHDRLRDGLLVTLDDEERVALHRQVARAVEQTYPGDPEHTGALAYHWRMAGDADQEQRYARRAGEHAADRFANAEALAHLDRALELVPEGDLAERYSILSRRERVYNLMGNREAQRRDLDALNELLAAWGETGPAAADLANRQAEYLMYITDFRQAVSWADKAIALARAAGNVYIEALACLTRGQSLWRLAEFRDSRACLRRALELSRLAATAAGREQSGPARLAEATSLRILGNVDYYTGDYGTAVAHWQQALAISRQLGDRVGEASGLSNLGEAARSQGDYVHAQGCYEQRLRICRDIGERYGEAIALINLSLVAHNLGDHQTASDCALNAWHIAVEIGNRSQQGYALTNLGHALAGLGRLEDAEAAYRQAVDMRRDIGEHHLAIESLAGLARAALARQNRAAALAAVEEILTFLECNTLDGADEPLRVYLTCYQALHANQDGRATEVLASAYVLLQDQAAHVADKGLRRSFLENVPHHREIVRAVTEIRI